MARAARASGWRWRAIAPAAITSIPLVGFPLLYDEIKLTIRTAYTTRANPLKAAQIVYEQTDHFLNRGNFRPIGRFLENMEYSSLYEFGEATGLAPHAVHGVVRVAVIALLALVCSMLVAAIMRSAGAGAHVPALGLYALALAAVLVANGTGSPLVLFPFLFIGSAVLIVGAALLVGRDRDMATRSVTPGTAVVVFVAGAVCAMFYDLAYVAPAVAVVFVAARALAARMSLRQTWATAAAKRCVYLWAGFLTVFVPSRVVIAMRCSELDCYNRSDINVSQDALGLVPDRLVTAAPLAGWRYNANSAKAGIGDDLATLGANLLMLLLAAGIVIVAVRAARAAAKSPAPTNTVSPVSPAQAEPGTISEQPHWWRAAAGLGLVGVALAILPVTMAALSKWMQQAQPPIGQAWRETLVVQVAWSLLIFAVITAAIGLARSPSSRRVVIYVASTLLALAMGATLLSNWRLTTVYRTHPVTSVTKQMIVAALSNDPTPQGNAHRCSLVGHYRELADPSFPIEELLDQLMSERYGRPYCEPPP